MPADPSKAQSEAARRNGAASHGPATEEGKARSAQNAATHGLCAQDFALRPAEQRLMGKIETDLAELYRPRDALMAELVAALARNMLLWRRMQELEMAVLTSDVGSSWMEPEELAQAAKPRLPSLATLCRYRQRLEASENRLRARLEAMAEGGDVPAELPRAPRQATAAPRTSEPERPAPAVPLRPVNRQERRRMDALERQRARAG